MIKDLKKEKIDIYKIDDKKYMVISKCVQNTINTDRLYDILCKYAISRINANV